MFWCIVFSAIRSCIAFGFYWYHPNVHCKSWREHESEQLQTEHLLLTENTMEVGRLKFHSIAIKFNICFSSYFFMGDIGGNRLLWAGSLLSYRSSESGSGGWSPVTQTGKRGPLCTVPTLGFVGNVWSALISLSTALGSRKIYLVFHSGILKERCYRQ